MAFFLWPHGKPPPNETIAIPNDKQPVLSARLAGGLSLGCSSNSSSTALYPAEDRPVAPWRRRGLTAPSSRQQGAWAWPPGGRALDPRALYVDTVALGGGVGDPGVSRGTPSPPRGGPGAPRGHLWVEPPFPSADPPPPCFPAEVLLDKSCQPSLIGPPRRASCHSGGAGGRRLTAGGAAGLPHFPGGTMRG